MKTKISTSLLALTFVFFLTIGTFNSRVFAADSVHYNSHTVGQTFFDDIVPFYISLRSIVFTHYNGKYLHNVQSAGFIPKAREQSWEIRTHDIGVTVNGSLIKYTQSPVSYPSITSPNTFYGGHELYVGKYVSGTVRSSINMNAYDSLHGWFIKNNYVSDSFTIK